MKFRAIVSKSVKRFSDKNCGKNKEREHSAQSISAKNALERLPKSVKRFSDKRRGENKGLEQERDSKIAHFALADRRFRTFVYQLLFGVLLVILLIAAALTTYHNLQAQGITSGFGFLWRSTGWNVGVALLPVSALDPYWYVILLGFLNTLFAGLVSLLLATMIGTVIGLARISDNIPARIVASLYVEIFRNTPLILQLFFWYALSGLLPAQTQSFEWAGLFYLNNRGLFLPGFNVSNLTLFLCSMSLLVAMIIVTWVLLTRWLRYWQVAHKRLCCLAVFLVGVLAAILFLLQGHGADTALIDWPVRRGLNFTGGYRIQPEVMILIFAISLYGGAYIAEIVRGGFQAVGRGQIEAAHALSLTPWQNFALIRLPLALRSMLPMLSNQYIWLIKATTLGTVVGFTDIFLVVATGITQSGQTLEFIAILMGSFLVINLTFARIMAACNRAIALKGYGDKK